MNSLEMCIQAYKQVLVAEALVKGDVWVRKLLKGNDPTLIRGFKDKCADFMYDSILILKSSARYGDSEEIRNITDDLYKATGILLDLKCRTIDIDEVGDRVVEVASIKKAVEREQQYHRYCTIKDIQGVVEGVQTYKENLILLKKTLKAIDQMNILLHQTLSFVCDIQTIGKWYDTRKQTKDKYVKEMDLIFDNIDSDELIKGLKVSELHSEMQLSGIPDKYFEMVVDETDKLYSYYLWFKGQDVDRLSITDILGFR